MAWRTLGLHLTNKLQNRFKKKVLQKFLENSYSLQPLKLCFGFVCFYVSHGRNPSERDKAFWYLVGSAQPKATSPAFHETDINEL